MIIREMRQIEIEDMLNHISIGYLACSLEDKPYVIPLRFVYHSGYLYSLTTVGKKLEIMRKNNNVCISFSHHPSTNNWQSLVVYGLYEEIPKSLDKDSEHHNAHAILSNCPEWWEPAYAKTIIQGKERPLDPVYFRISLSEKTGHKAEVDH